MEIDIYSQLAKEQEHKLDILKKLKERQGQYDTAVKQDSSLRTARSTSVINKITNFLFFKNKKQASNPNELGEEEKQNIIKYSIFEKRVFKMPSEIIDYAFIPITIPRRVSSDMVVIAFAANGNSSADVWVTDMRG